MKKIEKRIPVSCMIAFACLVLERWISLWSPFEDQDFLCGALLGAGIVLMLQAVWSMGRMLGKNRGEE